ncbi:ABC transporter substrate-binding protein [Vibrio sp. WXL103]|uniref:ABC transporter substrate-binding protein n=1 Tax=unclassified Vibrio TaxID=2614977 RepID=UPI003EC7227C
MKALTRLTFALVGASTLAGCGKPIEHTKIRQHGFTFCGQGVPETFNPQLVDHGITAEAISPQLFDTLLVLDTESYQPQANIATHWSTNAERTEYVFHLRDDVEFQTTQWFTPSRPLNADDVVFSFERIIDSQHPFHYTGGGLYPWFSSINFAGLVDSVESLDSHTVIFRLSRPDNAFLSNIATSFAVIHSEEYARTLEITDNKHQLDSHPIGTGPFYLDEHQINDLVRLKRHDGYWNGPAKMEQVVFDISVRGTGTLAKLLRKECDVLTSPISSQLPVIEQQDELVLETKPAMNVAYISVYTQHPALSDPRVRKALSLAINRENILDSVYYGTGTQAYTLLPPNSWAYQQDTVQVRYDRNYALGLLRDAGYESGLTLVMSVPLEPKAYNPSPRKTAELIQANFADIGVELNIITDERYGRNDAAQAGRFDLMLTGWIGDTGDPDNFLRPLLSCDAKQSGVNQSSWCNQDFDFLINLALEVDKPRYRTNIYRQVQNLLNQEVPVIPIAHGMHFQAHHQSLQGFRMSPFNVQPFNAVERVK